MKLFIENHPDFKKLSDYFKQIEALAENKGIAVDDLVKERSDKSPTMYTLSKMNNLALLKRRSHVLKNSTNERTAHAISFFQGIAQIRKEK